MQNEESERRFVNTNIVQLLGTFSLKSPITPDVGYITPDGGIFEIEFVACSPKL